EFPNPQGLSRARIPPTPPRDPISSRGRRRSLGFRRWRPPGTGELP
uniref:Uncharacterized protein n=1 Tax=Aegilops tauschii subsp. strangulata TaxID=200361 RepID=A0A453JKR3_AEGTS